MREKLKALAELQKVDMEAATLRKAADVHPKQIAELERELGAARSAIEAERARVADIERQKLQLEQNITDEKDKVKKWEARLAEQRSTREYSALAREIDIAKKANLTMAEELSSSARRWAPAREAVKAQGGRVRRPAEEPGRTDDRAARQAGRGREPGEGARGQARRARPRRWTPRCCAATRRSQEEAAGDGRRGAGTCQGCNMNVPPQLYNTLRTSLGTDVCPSCNRIIYAAEALEAEPTSK